MVFGNGQSNGVIEFFPGPSLVARVTKFGTKWLCKRYLQDFCGYRGIFGDKPLNAANRILFLTDSRCNGNEIRDKMGYSSTYVRDISEILASNKGF